MPTPVRYQLADSLGKYASVRRTRYIEIKDFLDRALFVESDPAVIYQLAEARCRYTEDLESLYNILVSIITRFNNHTLRSLAFSTLLFLDRDITLRSDQEAIAYKYKVACLAVSIYKPQLPYFLKVTILDAIEYSGAKEFLPFLNSMLSQEVDSRIITSIKSVIDKINAK